VSFKVISMSFNGNLQGVVPVDNRYRGSIKYPYGE
jgi:hypothetical protein